MGSQSPPSSSGQCNSSSWPVTLEVSVYTNNHHKDDVHLTTLVEETHLDPIQEDDQDRLWAESGAGTSLADPAPMT